MESVNCSPATITNLCSTYLADRLGSEEEGVALGSAVCVNHVGEKNLLGIGGGGVERDG